MSNKKQSAEEYLDYIIRYSEVADKEDIRKYGENVKLLKKIIKLFS